MPREQVNKPATRIVTVAQEAEGKAWAYRFMQDGEDFPTDPNTHLEPSPTLHVGWHKQGTSELPDECVTINIDVAEEEILRAADDIRARRLYLRQQRGDVVSADIDTPQYEGVWWSGTHRFHTVKLTRQEINHTIRTLRRARDGAYGTDE